MKNGFQSIWENLTPEEKRALAKKLRTSVAYLSQIAHEHARPGRKMISKMIRADGRITAEMFL